MRPPRVLYCVPLLFALVGVRAAEKKTPVFDRGEKDDLEKGVVYKSEKKQKESDKQAKKKEIEKKQHTLRYHLKNLRDADPEVRQSSAEMLGYLGIPESIPDLIDVLRPDRNEKVGVQLTANASLAKITGKNYGAKNYDGWMKWWGENKEEFLKKAQIGVDDTAKYAGIAANTIGLDLMRRGEHRSAEEQFITAIDKDPTVPDYQNNMGLCLMEQGRYLDAMGYFDETIHMNPELPQPYMNMGMVYSRMKKTIEAQEWYKKAMKKDKDGKLWEPFWMLGKEHMQRSEWSMAYEYLDQARVKAEKNRIHDPRLYKDLAITHYGLDQYHSAWKEITNVKTLGYECDKGFVAKVRKALVDQGYDPDVEDKKARKVLLGADEEEEAAKAP